MRRIDAAAFNVGLACVGLAVLTLWSSFGTVDWRIVPIVAPLVLVAIGLAGLLLSRASQKGPR